MKKISIFFWRQKIQWKKKKKIEIYQKNYLAGISKFLTTINTSAAITTNLIKFEITFPRKTPFRESSSRLSILNFLKKGERINGVTRSSIKEEAKAVTCAPITNQIANPITL